MQGGAKVRQSLCDEGKKQRARAVVREEGREPREQRSPGMGFQTMGALAACGTEESDSNEQGQAWGPCDWWVLRCVT